ncbi:MAG: HEAT repeat domain-containing protein [Planctomycetes bacterium]|nr:HEAT repeat domain-containing protein [Planctomycetota bacterium]
MIKEKGRGPAREKIALAVVVGILLLIAISVVVRDRMALNEAFRSVGDTNPDIRLWALEVILPYGDRAIPRLMDELQSQQGIGLAMCAIIAGRLRVEQAVPRLIEILSDPSWKVRQSAASALGRLKATEAVTPLIKCLGDKVMSVRRNSAIALGRIGEASRPAAPKLIELLSSATELRQVKMAAARALGRIGDERALQPILKLLDPKDFDFGKAAVRALGDLGSPKAVEPLCKFLTGKGMEDLPPAIRVAGVKALVKIGDKRAVPTLKVLADGTKTISWLVRQAAVEALAKMGE